MQWNPDISPSLKFSFHAAFGSLLEIGSLGSLLLEGQWLLVFFRSVIRWSVALWVADGRVQFRKAGSDVWLTV